MIGRYMRTTVFFILFCWLLALPALGEPLLKSITAQELRSVLSQAGFENCQINSDGDVQFEFEESILRVTVHGKFLIAWDLSLSKDYTLQQLNDWNAKHLVARTYIRDEALMFRAYLSLAPGVSRKSIEEFMWAVFVEQERWVKEFGITT